ELAVILPAASKFPLPVYVPCAVEISLPLGRKTIKLAGASHAKTSEDELDAKRDVPETLPPTWIAPLVTTVPAELTVNSPPASLYPCGRKRMIPVSPDGP